MYSIKSKIFRLVDMKVVLKTLVVIYTKLHMVHLRTVIGPLVPD